MIYSKSNLISFRSDVQLKDEDDDSVVYYEIVKHIRARKNGKVVKNGKGYTISKLENPDESQAFLPDWFTKDRLPN